MEHGYSGRYHKKVENALLAGIVCLIIFLVTAFGAKLLFQKSAGEIRNNYETVRVTACEKIISRPVRSKAKYYIRGIAEDGYEGIFWVRKELYQKLEVGGVFNVYKYGDCYGSTLHSLVSENAGMAYTVLYFAAIVTAPMSIVFTVIGIVQKIKGRRHRCYRYRDKHNIHFP